MAELFMNRKSRYAAAAAAADDGATAPAPGERHFTPAEVAELWHFDVETIRRLFDNEPGVMVLQTLARRGKRPYRTIRIPQSVLDRVHRRLVR